MSIIVAIEGIDGASKFTQATLLANKLNGLVISFPNYSTPTGELIARHLKGETLPPVAFQSLQTVNKLEALPMIKEAQRQNIPIIFDRYYMSGMVYGQLDNLNGTWLDVIHSTLPEPTLWIFLDLPKEESFNRRPERRDNYEKDIELMGRARDKYLKVAKTMTNAYIVNALGTKEEVHNTIMEIVNNYWKIHLNKVLECLEKS